MLKSLSVNKIIEIILPNVIDVVILSVVLMLLFSPVSSELFKDGDVGYHIATGKYILSNLTLPTLDFYSYTCPGKHWVAFSWGCDVIWALLNSYMGLNGIAIFSVLLIVGVIYIVYKLLIYWEISFSVLIVTVLASICLLTSHWLARPHLFTIFFTILVFYLLEISKDNKKFYLFIPVIMMFWCNIHPGFISGFFLLAVYIVGNLVEFFLHSKHNNLKYLNRFKYILFVSSISFLLTLINPYGFDLYFYIKQTLSSNIIVNKTAEYLSPNFHENFRVLLYGLIIVFIIAGLLKLRHRVLDSSKIILILLWTHLSLFSVRNIAIFAVLVVPCLAIILDENLKIINNKRINDLSLRLKDLENTLKYHLWPTILCIIILCTSLNGGYIFNKKLLNLDFPKKYLPIQAMESFNKYPPSGNIFNYDNWGGYIIYKYPEIRVFIDGRLDMYQQDFLKEYQDIVTVTHKTKILLDKYCVNWILFQPNTVFYNYLKNNPEWKLYYNDSTAGIFVRVSPISR